MSTQQDKTSESGEDSDEAQYSTKVESVAKRLHFHIHDYEKKRNRNRKMANTFKLATVCLGGLVTLLLGVKPYIQSLDNKLSLIALVCSTAMTAMASWEAFTDYRGKWIGARSILVTLYGIKDDLRFALTGESTPPPANEYYERLKLALNQTNEEWEANRGKMIRGATVTPNKAE
jgi:Protein of unknown function (DUF4231)